MTREPGTADLPVPPHSVTADARPRLWLDGGRVCHDVGLDTISNDLAGWIDDDLVSTGLVPPADFETVFVEVIRSLHHDPDVAWTAFYRNTLDGTGGLGPGMAPVHARAVSLASGPQVVELGSCCGFLSLQLAAAGYQVTAVDIEPGTLELLGCIAPRLGLPMTTMAADARAVPVADRSADTVYAVHLLEHLPHDAAPVIVQEMLRIARHRVVVAVPFEDEPNPTWGHVRTFDLDVLDALGAATGRPYRVEEHHGGWLVLDL